MASREYEALVAALKDRPLITGAESLAEARETLEAMHGHPIAEDTRVERLTLGGVPCAWIDVPETRESERVVFLCHGGAYVAACGDGYLFYAEMLARPFDARVLLVDYRLAPEHRHPAALNDLVSAYAALLESGCATHRIGFVGDSCGGALALGTLLRLRDAGVPLPACAATLGGWFDLEATGEAATQPVAPEPFAHRDFVRARGRDYVGPEGDLRDPLASPIHADLSGLPPLFLQSGQIDLTRDDAIRLGARAGRDGVDVTIEIVPEMIHGFQGLASAGIPEAQAALGRTGAWVRARTS
jgi:monoterpene epsilon-lactone hydrolase